MDLLFDCTVVTSQPESVRRKSLLWCARSFNEAKNDFNPLLKALLIGTLITAAIPMVPTAQPHYFMLSTILITVLISAQWERTGIVELSPGWIVVFVVFGVLSSLSEIPGFEVMMTLERRSMRDYCCGFAA